MNVRVCGTSGALSILKRFRTKIFGLIKSNIVVWQKKILVPSVPGVCVGNDFMFFCFHLARIVSKAEFLQLMLLNGWSRFIKEERGK